MKLIHTGLAASSEEHADRFFIDILGLDKSTPKTLGKGLARTIFGINEELLMINYRCETAHYEIFVYQGYRALVKQVTHSCIEVVNRKDLVNKCRVAGTRVQEIPKGPGTLVFISDFDGNLFEVKERGPASR